MVVLLLTLHVSILILGLQLLALRRENQISRQLLRESLLTLYTTRRK